MDIRRESRLESARSKRVDARYGSGGFAWTVYLFMRHHQQPEIAVQMCALHGNKVRDICNGQCLTTDPVTNIASMAEVLVEDGDQLFVGTPSATRAAAPLISARTPGRNARQVLRSIILDEAFPTVGGPMQHGTVSTVGFRVAGELSFGPDVHYWRGGIDFNASEFQTTAPFIPAVSYMEVD